MFTLSIRRASAADEEDIVALWRTCGLETSHNNPPHDFRFARAKPNSDILVGLGPEERIVATVMTGHDGHRGWLYYVATAPDCQSQGIGRQMVEAGEEWLRSRGVVKVMLLVRDTNTQVVDFYKHIGFDEIPRVVMQKWLCGNSQP